MKMIRIANPNQRGNTTIINISVVCFEQTILKINFKNMKKAIAILITSIVLILTLGFVNNKNQSKIEYVLLQVGHFGAGMNNITAVYENGTKEDLVKKLNLKIKGDWNSQENFVEEIKAYKYLNESGYKLNSSTCDLNNDNVIYSYIFTK
jgi:hypothetical protein